MKAVTWLGTIVLAAMIGCDSTGDGSGTPDAGKHGRVEAGASEGGDDDGGGESADPCATDNGGCGSATYFSCTHKGGAAPVCEDIDECVTDNGGCGKAKYFSCTNNTGEEPTCEDIDECATDNGGCGDAQYFSCTNNAGEEPTCEDIDECATDNGGCGSKTHSSCIDNAGCEDIDECATDNGACGCTVACVNEGAAPTCNAADECTPQTEGSTANHVIVNVMWPANTGVAAGTGQVHFWNKADLVFATDGSAKGTVTPCGIVQPAFQKMGLAGMNKLKIEFPKTTFDSPMIPTAKTKGTLTPPAGSDNPFAVGATFAMEPVGLVAGVTLADPVHDAWFTQGMGSKAPASDDDGDGKPGLTAIPRKATGYDQPAVSVFAALGNAGPFADELYLGMRQVVRVNSVRDCCASAQGTALVMELNSRVLGCHRTDGKDCTAAETDFIDANLPDLTVVNATYEMIRVPASTTCAEIRAMLPAK